MKIRIRLGSLFKPRQNRFPAPTLLCALFAVSNIVGEVLLTYYADRPSWNAFISNSVFPALIMGIFLSATAACCSERYHLPRFLQWIAAAVGALFGLVIWKSAAVTLGVCLCCVVLCLHFVSRKDAPEARLAQICGWFCASLFVSGVLFAALALCASAFFALLAHDASYQFETLVYLSAASLSFFAFAPWLFLNGLPDEDAPSEKPSDFRKFADIVMLPCYLLLLIVLLIYVAQIAVAMTMPVGVINGYSIAALTFFIFFHLILTGEEGRLSRLFKRWGGWLLIPVVITQAIAVHMRVSAYGLTESRVLGMVWSALCFAAVVASLFRRRASWFFLAAAAVSIVIFCTPLSAANLAIMSQESRLSAALERNSMLGEQGEIIANPDAAAEDKEIIYSAADYLEDVSAREGSLSAQLQKQLAQINEENEYSRYSSSGKIELLGFGRPEASEEWSIHRCTFKGTASSTQLETRGYAHAELITVSQRTDGVKTFTYPGEDYSDSRYGTADIGALTELLEANRESNEPFTLDIPLTFVIDGEEIDLAPLLSGAQLDDNTAQMTEDILILPSGKKLHFKEVEIVNYADADSADSITFTAWLLSPDTE